jgi:hypothetical protein
MSAANRLTTSAEVLVALDAIERDGGAIDGPWSLPQVLAHCAQSVEMSISGYPSPRGWLVRRVAGPLVMRRSLRRGFLTHDLAAEIPGAPPLGAPSIGEAVGRLRAALAAFEAHQGPLAPHFAYGPVEKAQYEALHAMHVADHLGALRAG